jgi:formate dehydrogenase subunit gamma
MADGPVWTAGRVAEIVAAHAHLEGPLLPILHALQAAFGFVPRDAVPVVAEALNLTRAEVYGVVSFYHDFREAPAGRRVVKVCRAEACQSMGGVAVADAVLKHFRVGWGETSADGAVTVEPVYCLGFCSVAPAALVDGEPHGRVEAGHLIALAEHKP